MVFPILDSCILQSMCPVLYLTSRIWWCTIVWICYNRSCTSDQSSRVLASGDLYFPLLYWRGDYYTSRRWGSLRFSYWWSSYYYVDRGYPKKKWMFMYQELLDFTPDSLNFSRVRFKMSCLNATLETLFQEFDTSNDACRQRACIYIMMLLEEHLFSNKSGNLVSLRLFSFLRDLEMAGQCNWG